jgi:hypothetical protein
MYNEVWSDLTERSSNCHRGAFFAALQHTSSAAEFAAAEAAI